ncbi:DUF3093 domain-containing protein [Rhodococcus erythropolis]|uniref:DUF3093 domain-containing protein n=1 Tax=Rhodococcus TaxID=1827 RepID=UPI00096A9460|nr:MULTISPECIES: DUF3093 domain-containing protein [Rhodococcus]MBJ7477844.1 DUF3093 domain-containing protein [Rhodococcus sp. (in: high G+C Gram-positive bacteria)]NHP12933.1 DUF3093 domain-containing protein [Rhodococcus sp. IC4_135]RQO41889.1 DUF3093 domain-containing protein [Rhodococcus sp. KBW08]
MPETSRPDVATTTPPSTTLYSERLWVPIWWWIAGLAVAGLLAAEVHMGRPGLLSYLAYVVLLPIPIWAAFWLSRMRVEVVETAGVKELHVGRAHLPVELISRAAAVPASAKSAAMGRQLDPSAFVQHRPWVKTMVLIVLDDPEDPTPYWLVSTRRPADLLAALDR